MFFLWQFIFTVTGANMPLINGYYNYAGGLKSSTSSMLGYMKRYLESQDDVVKQAMVRLAGDDRYGRAFAWNTYNYDEENKCYTTMEALLDIHPGWLYILSRKLVYL